MFKKNINRAERILRLLLAIILFVWAIWQHSFIVLIVSLFLFFEVFISWCLLYQLIGKNSCPLNTSNPSDDSQDDKKLK